MPVVSPLALTSLSDPHFTLPWTPELTILSTQATERPAKRLATPRATFTSSFRMSSHRLLRNLNNLSVYVATPGERRKERLVDGGPGCRYVSGHLPQVVGAAGRWVISLLKVSTPCSTRSSRQDSSVWGGTQLFSIERRDSEAYANGHPGPQKLWKKCYCFCVSEMTHNSWISHSSLCSYSVIRDILGLAMLWHPASTQNVCLSSRCTLHSLLECRT